MIIYVVTCINSRKQYVGKTSRLLDARWKWHCYSALTLQSSTHFHRAIRKYGVEAFELKVVQECLTNDELNVAEIAWIAKLNTFPDGYNETRGGEGTPGYRHTADAKRKMSLARLGERNANYKKDFSPETRKRMRLAKLGKKRPLHTEETKAKMREAWKLRKVKFPSKKR